MMKKPILYIFSGLPASGKSTLAKSLARHFSAAHVRIDSFEQGLRDFCGIKKVEAEGYLLAYKVSNDILSSGCSVVADSVNSIEVTRSAWNRVATDIGVDFVNIEVVCSDPSEHRRRVESRDADIENLKLPTWEQVSKREYENWTVDRIKIDTAGKSIEASMMELLASL